MYALRGRAVHLFTSQSPKSQALAATIARARTAVQSRQSAQNSLETVSEAAQHGQEVGQTSDRPGFPAFRELLDQQQLTGGHSGPQRTLQASSRASQRRAALTVPEVTMRPIAPDPKRVRVAVAPPVLDTELIPPDLAAGPRRLLELLHRLSRELSQVRGYAVMPSQIVLHLSQELLAAALGVHRVTVWRWTTELEAWGLVQARAHKGTALHQGAAVTRNDGTLYAIALKAGHCARLRFDDLKHQYRDLEADRRAGRTAYQTLQQSVTQKQLDWYLVLRDWAVSPGNTQLTPVVAVDCCTRLNTVQDVVCNLHLIATCHATKRAALIGILGAGLARALGDLQSRRWYCGLLWRAWRAELEGRAALQGLGAQLARLGADRAEWAGLRCPGALLATRLGA